MHLAWPLDTYLFPSPSDDDAHRYKSIGDASLRCVLDAALSVERRSAGWRRVGSFNDVSLYEGESAVQGMIPFRIVAKASATLEEIAQIHDFSTHAKCQVYKSLYADDILAMTTLHSFYPRTPHRPFKQLYLKWNANRSPVPMIKDRDFIYVEAQDEVRLTSGRRGWVYAQTSVDVPGFPIFDEAVRGNLYMGMGVVYLETETPGELHVIYHLCVDFKGHIPHWVFKLGMKGRARNIQFINDRVHRLRLSNEPLQQPSAPTSPTTCATCHRHSHAFCKHRCCQACGEVVCSKCSRSWRLSGLAGDSRVYKACVCNVCSQADETSPSSDGNLHYGVGAHVASDDGSSASGCSTDVAMDLSYLAVYQTKKKMT
ncbi:hypothetical protein SPRG_06377 [Saprolegnia parasitica CBS 223.65]|uniref:FYVE-type domain-containing protein n=1 Tax=Saprolegnia parasitica (strain CBS 223.65) TaxID=695850 RepID=A0A067CCL9_SAPPC|nr:hypothetical protein SPRG_06377 [Saprolegnia parasitica CBS 223.65]KDO28519.1 hypothetical protein SPRG_06377 [Saprolegnia parasitica CBS 223.65]|eukprot:XP_012200585.1 hypothetical protein SPRG_06377 [Saprolegnia parasitica CBS 223.65]